MMNFCGEISREYIENNHNDFKKLAMQKVSNIVSNHQDLFLKYDGEVKNARDIYKIGRGFMVDLDDEDNVNPKDLESSLRTSKTCLTDDDLKLLYVTYSEAYNMVGIKMFNGLPISDFEKSIYSSYENDVAQFVFEKTISETINECRKINRASTVSLLISTSISLILFAASVYIQFMFK